MIFEIHNEGKIAFKRLSDADLERSGRSHQTHIGLSVDSLTFMPDDKKEYSAMLIYDDYCDILSCEIAKIHRASGRYDAPNIKKGKKRGENVVSKIRSFAADCPTEEFFLLWFGLDSLTPVFWLIKNGSTDFISLNRYCGFSTLRERKIAVLGRDSHGFQPVLQYAQKKLENVTVGLQKDLEYAVEMENDNPKFKDADVRKTKSYISELGKAGERLINEYLGIQKSKREIEDFDWTNKNGEQGKPYDFYIKHNDGLEQWIDVKTTEHEFEQLIIVSRNEVKFITEKKNFEYAVFRVYSKREIAAKLRVCSDCLKYIKKLYRDIEYMKDSMADYRATIMNYKIAFEPCDLSFRQISPEISLPII